MNAVNDTASHRYLTFRVDEQLYALRADQVAEVIRMPLVARIPQAPPALSGLANLRGVVLPIASLRILLDKPAVDETESTRVIVLDLGAPIALTVDAINALETIAADQIETQKKEVGANAKEKLVGAFASRTDKSVAKVLDIKPMLEAAFKNRGRGQKPVHKSGVAATLSTEKIGKSVEQIVSFDVGGQEFALPLGVVQEILPSNGTVTSVARADSAVLGVIAVRDSLVPLLSLRGLLGFASAEAGAERQKIIVMKIAGTEIGLVADRARAILAADKEQMDDLPPILAVRTGGESRIRSIYRAEEGRRLISILSPEQLFREDVMQRLTANQQMHQQRVPGAQSAQNEVILLVFRLGADEFGLPIEAVVEVAHVPEQITRVPKTPKFLEGVVNLRGDVLPVVDQRRRFEMPALAQTDGRKLIVVKTDRFRAGLIVDSVTDVLRTSQANIEPPPDLTDATSRLVRGVVNLEAARRMVLLLDPTEMLTRAEQSALDTFEAAGQKAHA